MRTKSAAPKALQAKVDRAAKIIQRHGKVLGQVGIDALRVATLQVVSQQLTDIQALLQANGLTAVVTSGQLAHRNLYAPPSEPAGPKCSTCGRPGVYQSKTALVPKGKERPWACTIHANQMRQEDGETKLTERMMGPQQIAAPSGAQAPPAVPPSNLAAAMAALAGGEE